jgi:hypothetical protein
MNEEPARGPGIAVLVIPIPGGMAVPTDTFPGMIDWLYRHGGPRTGEVLTRLERHGWELELLASPTSRTRERQPKPVHGRVGESHVRTVEVLRRAALPQASAWPD